MNKDWHLDKTFNVGHVLTTLSLCVGLAGYIVTMDKRLAVVETQHQAQVTSLQRTQQDQQALSKDIRDELRALRTELMTVMRDQNQNRGKL